MENDSFSIANPHHRLSISTKGRNRFLDPKEFTRMTNRFQEMNYASTI